jgi:hypothetical protein
MRSIALEPDIAKRGLAAGERARALAPVTATSGSPSRTTRSGVMFASKIAASTRAHNTGGTDMPDGIRWVDLDLHARESTVAVFDQPTGEVATRRVVGRP